MKKASIIRILTVILAATVISGCLTSVASAEQEDENLHLWICGEYITKETAADPFGDGKVSYDPDTNTLTLNGFSYSGDGEVWEYNEETIASCIVYDGDDDFTLVLLGENVMTHPGGHDYSSCVFCSSRITVKGPGTLTASSGTANKMSYVIYGMKGLVMESGTVTVRAGDSSGDSVGLHSTEEVIINGGTVVAKGGVGSGTSVGIYGKAALTVNGGDITAGNEPGSGFSAAMLSNTITVNGGRVVAEGGAGNYSSGLYSKKEIIINGGDITAIGGTADQYSDGIYSSGDFTVNGGSLTATGGSSGLGSGLYQNDGTVKLSGGTITLSGGDGEKSRGINISENGNINILIGENVSSLTISGKTAALSGKLSSKIGGAGYENTDGTGQRSYITPDTEITDPEYKMISFPQSASETGFPWLWVVLPVIVILAAAAVVVIIKTMKKKSS